MASASASAGAADAKASSKPQLTYFNGRGRAECARFLFKEGKVDFDDHRVDQKEWAALKDKQPFGQLPVLTVGGHTVAQSGAIERYAAKVAHLYGANELDAAKIDQVTEGVSDLLVKFRATYQEKDAENKKKMVEAYFKDEFPKWAGFLEALLKSNNGGAGYFVGNGATYADIHFYVYTYGVTEANGNAWKAFPLLEALRARVAARPNIAAWLAARPNTPF